GPPLPEGIIPPSGRLRAAGRWEPLPALSELPPLRVVVPEARSPGSPGRGVASPTRGCRFRLHPLERLRKTPFIEPEQNKNNIKRNGSQAQLKDRSENSQQPPPRRRAPIATSLAMIANTGVMGSRLRGNDSGAAFAGATVNLCPARGAARGSTRF